MLTENNIEDRLRFCQFLRAQGFAAKTSESQWKLMHVMFTDESPIELHPKPNSQNMRFYTDSIKKVPTIKRPKFGLNIMVAGGITGFGKTPLVIVDQGSTLNAEEY